MSRRQKESGGPKGRRSQVEGVIAQYLMVAPTKMVRPSES